MKKIILILNLPRTGSSLLVSQIENVYRDVRNFNELLGKGQPNCLFDNLKNSERKKLENLLEIGIDDRSMLNKLYNDPVNFLKKLNQAVDDIIVMKILAGQVELPTLFKIIDLPETEVVILERSSYLKSYVSWIKRQQFNADHNIRTDSLKINLNFANFLEHMVLGRSWYYALREYCKCSGKNYFDLNYEKHLSEISKDTLSSLDMWFDSVGINIVAGPWVPPKLIKMNQSPIENSIENWEEIQLKLLKIQKFYDVY